MFGELGDGMGEMYGFVKRMGILMGDVAGFGRRVGIFA